MAEDEFDIHAFLAQEAMLTEQSNQTFESKIDLANLPDYYLTIWPKQSNIVAGWLNQTFGSLNEPHNKTGILQVVNGPCGVLSVVQALLYSTRLKSIGYVDETLPVSDAELAGTLAQIINLHQIEDKVKVVLWKDEIGKSVVSQEIEISNTCEFIKKQIESYKNKGALCLLLYSIVETKTLAVVKKEIKSNGGGPSLVETTTNPDIWFCSSELMTLLLTGNADGNMGAYGLNKEKRSLLKKPLPVGMLSRREKQTKIPLLDEFKHPEFPVWILHGGDHFTTFCQRNLKDQNSFFHFNGLPPGGPRICNISLEFTKTSKPVAAKLEETEYLPLPGEIYDIVQAEKLKTKPFTEWKYELVLAVEDRTSKGAKRPKELAVHIFDLGAKPVGRWRCANCYRNRHKTYCFGDNKPLEGTNTTPDICKYCNKTKKEAQWSIWLPYSKLPNGWKRSAQFHYGPKILSVLVTRWLDAEIINPDKLEDMPSV